MMITHEQPCVRAYEIVCRAARVESSGLVKTPNANNFQRKAPPQAKLLLQASLAQVLASLKRVELVPGGRCGPQGVCMSRHLLRPSWRNACTKAGARRRPRRCFSRGFSGREVHSLAHSRTHAITHSLTHSLAHSLSARWIVYRTSPLARGSFVALALYPFRGLEMVFPCTEIDLFASGKLSKT